MNAERLAEIRERAENATPGIWSVRRADPEYSVIIEPTDDYSGDCMITFGSEILQDARFIAHSRADIPDLLAEVDRLTRELAEAQGKVDGLLSLLERSMSGWHISGREIQAALSGDPS